MKKVKTVEKETEVEIKLINVAERERKIREKTRHLNLVRYWENFNSLWTVLVFPRA